MVIRAGIFNWNWGGEDTDEEAGRFDTLVVVWRSLLFQLIVFDWSGKKS